MTIECLLSREKYPSFEQVSSIDPLEVDQVMSYLPEMNRQGDVKEIHEAAQYAVSGAEDLTAPTRTEALASIRDIDFLASSLLKHGEQPIVSIAGMEEQFIRMGKIANTVPRGTVFTYTAGNPSDERRRSFTGSNEEEVFIDSVARSIIALDDSVMGLGQTSLMNDAGLYTALLQSGEAMNEMIDSIVQVKRTVSPDFFTFQMRPFFEPLVIDGESLTGAGGAQMQLLAVDRMLWGCEDKSPEYEEFFAKNYIYLTPTQQEALVDYACINGNKSIVSWINDNPGKYPEITDATVDLLKKIKKFRFPHRRIAQDNFKLRPSDAVGSGNYKPDILDLLIEKTKASIVLLEKSNNA